MVFNAVMLAHPPFHHLRGFAGGFVTGPWIAVNLAIVAIAADIIRARQRSR